MIDNTDEVRREIDKKHGPDFVWLTRTLVDALGTIDIFRARLDSVDMPASVIVSCIAADISDRAGIGDEWGQIDDDVKGEIMSEWTEIARRCISITRGSTPEVSDD